MKSSILHALVSGFIVAPLLILPARANDISTLLGDTTDLRNFAMFGNNLDINLFNVNGNVGTDHSSTFKFSTPSVINGNLYLAPAFSGGLGTVHGTIFNPTTTGPNGVTLANTYAELNTAATAMRGFGATTTVSGNKISTATTITTTPGALTVLNLSGGINLNNANLTVNGGGYLVINVTGGGVSLTGTASILAGASENANQIFVNLDGSSAEAMNTHINDVADGYYFFPNGDSATLDGVFNGGLYGSSGQVEVLSNGQCTESQRVPDGGSTLWLMGTGLAALFAGYRFINRGALVG